MSHKKWRLLWIVILCLTRHETKPSNFRQKITQKIITTGYTKLIDTLILQEQVPHDIVKSSIVLKTIQHLTNWIKHHRDPNSTSKPCSNPNIIQLFNAIKMDMGITEHIDLFESTDPNVGGLYTYYHNAPPTITLSAQPIKENNYPLLVHIIAHELGHHLQHNDYPCAYKYKYCKSKDETKANAIKREIGADATAAGYQDCKYCLRYIKSMMGSKNNKKGYFSGHDYAPYIQRAEEEDWACPAHDNLRKQSALKLITHAFGLSSKTYQATDYLPSTYDRSKRPNFIHYNELKATRPYFIADIVFGALITCFVIMKEYQNYLHKKRQDIIKEYDLTPCTNPEILELFNTIKMDMGITENIPLFITNNQKSFCDGLYYDFPHKNPFIDTRECMGIAINLKAIGNEPSTIVHVLARELGQFLQYNNYPGAYKALSKSSKWLNNASRDQKNEDSMKLKTGAEATAAGYQDCQYCLHEIRKQQGCQEGSATHLQGYFSQLDYKSYIERAAEHNWACPAHDDQRKQSILNWFSQKQYKATDYLPQTYDRSKHPQQSKVETSSYKNSMHEAR